MSIPTQPNLDSLAAITTALSTKGRLCTRKDLIVSKLEALASHLQALTDGSSSRTAYRQAVETEAKQRWLDSEGQRAMLQKTVEKQELDIAAGLKLAVGLQDIVDDDRARLAALQANITAELREIDEEEAMIREQLALTKQLTDSHAVRELRPHCGARVAARVAAQRERATEREREACEREQTGGDIGGH